MGLVGRVEGEGMTMRGLLWGLVVHVPLGGSTEGALQSRHPASLGGIGSVPAAWLCCWWRRGYCPSWQLRRRILHPWRWVAGIQFLQWAIGQVSR